VYHREVDGRRGGHRVQIGGGGATRFTTPWFSQRMANWLESLRDGL